MRFFGFKRKQNQFKSWKFRSYGSDFTEISFFLITLFWKVIFLFENSRLKKIFFFQKNFGYFWIKFVFFLKKSSFKKNVSFQVRFFGEIVVFCWKKFDFFWKIVFLSFWKKRIIFEHFRYSKISLIFKNFQEFLIFYRILTEKGQNK